MGNKTKFIKTIFLLLVSQTLGCISGTKSTTDTGSPQTDVTLSQASEIQFLDTCFYASGNTSGSWNTFINSSNITIGVIPNTISIPSELVNQSYSSIVSGIKTSTADCKSNSIDPANNKIPYFAIKVDPTISKYVFDFKKYTTTSVKTIGTILGQYNGEFIVEGDFAYLPLINERFGGKLYSSNDNPANLTYSLSVTAIPKSGLPSKVKTVTFKLDLQFTAKGISTEIRNNFDLSSRWGHYYKLKTPLLTTQTQSESTFSDQWKQCLNDLSNCEYSNTGNDFFDVIKVTSDDTYTEPTETDIKIVFQSPPTLKMREELFVEETLDLEKYRTTKVISLQRGKKFRIKTVELDSVNHFSSKFRVNGVDSILKDKAIIGTVPANTKWNFVVGYDFKNASAVYPSITSSALLSPLRPECFITKGQQFPSNPANDFVKKLIASKTRNGLFNPDNASTKDYYLTCHPDTNNTEPTPLNINYNATDFQGMYASGLRDTWNEFFAFRRQANTVVSNGAYVADAGHFYGIKSVSFYLSGCFKYYVRQHSKDGSFPWGNTPKNIADPNSTAKCNGEDGWSYFEIVEGRLKDDIGNHLSGDPIYPHLYKLNDTVSPHPDLGTLQSLIPVIDTSSDTRDDFMFNGMTNLFSIF